jgi:hypothetical protein
MQGCRRGVVSTWRSGVRARVVKQGKGRATRVEMRVRHPEVDDCVLVGMLSGDRTRR